MSTVTLKNVCSYWLCQPQGSGVKILFYSTFGDPAEFTRQCCIPVEKCHLIFGFGLLRERLRLEYVEYTCFYNCWGCKLQIAKRTSVLALSYPTNYCNVICFTPRIIWRKIELRFLNMEQYDPSPVNTILFGPLKI